MFQIGWSVGLLDEKAQVSPSMMSETLTFHGSPVEVSTLKGTRSHNVTYLVTNSLTTKR
jgi:hypothetical protein